MSTLSDLLGIPHFTTSRGSKVRKDFLLAVANSMGLSVPEGSTKDDVLKLVWEYTNKAEMPLDRFSTGATVTNDVLQEIINGVLANKIAVEVPDTSAEENVAGTFEDDLQSLGDDRTRALRKIAVREGQSSFRTQVLDAYKSKCAVTRTSIPATLEAAHITPYKGPWSNVTINGISLRRDIHSLFDRGLLAIHESGFKVLLAPIISSSTPYSELHGRRIALPEKVALRPSPSALKAHRIWSGLK